jgi:hypothetical protein
MFKQTMPMNANSRGVSIAKELYAHYTFVALSEPTHKKERMRRQNACSCGFEAAKKNQDPWNRELLAASESEFWKAFEEQNRTNM